MPSVTQNAYRETYSCTSIFLAMSKSKLAGQFKKSCCQGKHYNNKECYEQQSFSHEQVKTLLGSSRNPVANQNPITTTTTTRTAASKNYFSHEQVETLLGSSRNPVAERNTTTTTKDNEEC
jgi:vancomycin permeability regulator SanA